MRILVTGALGHIGSKLIRELKIGDELNFILVDNMSTQRFCSIFNLPHDKHYFLINDNVRNIKDHTKLIKDIDYVIHLAAITDAANSFENKDKVIENNLESTIVVADFCLKNNIPLIFPSSTSVYGPQEQIVDEDSTELAPQSPYAESKIREEEYITGLSNQGLKFCILRFGTIFGISQGMRFHTAVNKFCWQASLNEPITVWKTAYHQLRPYLDLDDAIKAIYHVIENDLFDQCLYNVVTENYTVKSVVDAIKLVKPSVKINFVDSAIMNQLSYCVSAKKIANTGFKVSGSLNVGIAETLALLGHKNMRSA